MAKLEEQEVIHETLFESEQYYGEINANLKKAIKNKPTIYRLTSGERRIYFTKEENLPIQVYNSGTTIIDNYRDKDGEGFLYSWKVGLTNKGKDPDAVLKERQVLGTLIHLLFSKVLLKEVVTYNTLDKFLIGMASEINESKAYVTGLVKRNLKEFKMKLASFTKWLIDFKVEPLANELMLKSDEYRVATALDLICYITDKEKGFYGETYKSGAKKGEPKETYKEVKRLVIVDYKSGKNFYDKNVLQLLESKLIFEENFPDVKVEGIYNFGANDWKGTTPTYKFYNQERENKNIDFLKSIFINVLERGKIEFEHKVLPKKLRQFIGTVDFSNLNLEGVVQYETMEETAERYWNEANKEVDPFKKFISDSNISNKQEAEVVLKDISVNGLKDLSKSLGVPYKTKKEFINQILEKY